MNRDLIKKYKAEFDHMVNGGSIYYKVGGAWFNGDSRNSSMFNWARPENITCIIRSHDTTEEHDVSCLRHWTLEEADDDEWELKLSNGSSVFGNDVSQLQIILTRFHYSGLYGFIFKI